MRRTPQHTPRASEITPLDVYLDRRRLLAGLAGGLLGLAAPTTLRASQLRFTKNARLSTREAPNSFDDITTYNNFYEFGTDKDDPARLGGVVLICAEFVKVVVSRYIVEGIRHR